MKSIKTVFSVVPLLAILINISSCSKDLDINADWRDITVVFGLLDQLDSVHYIKINKAFLGDEDAFVMAANQDSSEYTGLTAIIEQWTDGNKIKTYTLYERTVINKESGVFYYPEQMVYSFEEKNLDVESTYKLVATIGDKEVKAETEIINDMTIITNNWKRPGSSQGSAVSFAGGNVISNKELDVNVGKDAKRLEVYVNFNYTEITQFGTAVTDTLHTYKTLVLRAGDYAAATTNGGEKIEVSISGEDFFKQIGTNIPKLADSPSNVQKRVVEDFEIYVVAGGEALHTYMEVNAPTTGIVQEKDEYTNVSEGIGILSCRTSKTEAFVLSKSTIDELMGGLVSSRLSDDGEGYTVGRGFCNNYVAVTDPASCWFN